MNVAEEIVYGLLTGDAAIADVVADKIYYKVIPLGVALPAIAYERVGTEYVNSIHDSSQIAGRVQVAISCVTGGEHESNALANLVSLLPLLKTDRGDEYDQESETHTTTVTVEVWET